MKNKYWITTWKISGFCNIPITQCVRAPSLKDAYEQVIGRFSPLWKISGTYLLNGTKVVARVEKVGNGNIAKYIG